MFVFSCTLNVAANFPNKTKKKRQNHRKKRPGLKLSTKKSPIRPLNGVKMRPKEPRYDPKMVQKSPRWSQKNQMFLIFWTPGDPNPLTASPPPQAPTVSASRQPHTTKEPQKTLKTPKNGRKGQKKPNVVKTTPKRSRNSPNMV